MYKIILKNLLLVIVCICMDQVSKIIALNNYSIHKNFGVFLGFFSDAPMAFRVVTLSTFAGFLFFIYFALLYLLPNKVSFLKYDLSLIISGIFGNVFDRLIRGYTIDFIPMKFSSFEAYYNIADIFLWIGVCYFIYCIFKYDDIIWHPNNSRNNYLVNPKEQLRLAFKFSLVSILTSLLIGLFTYTFIKSFFAIHGSQLNEFLITYLILASLFAISTFLVGIIISHRSSGPLFAFEAYVKKLLEGKDERLILRDGDNYKHLEDVANKLHDHYFKK